MAKHKTHAQFTRQITKWFNEDQARQHRTIIEFEKLGRKPKSWPPKQLVNPLDRIVFQAALKASTCGCMRVHCRICGLVAFHARIRSVERPYLNTTAP